MTIHRYLRMIAGVVVLTGLTLGYFVDSMWLLLTAFAGLNLLQSAFSDWCPMMTILRRMGAKDCQHEVAKARHTTA